MRTSSFLSFAVGVCGLCTAASAFAYPTAVVFVPTGDTRELGQVGAMVYTALNYRAKDAGSNELHINMASAWVTVGAFAGLWTSAAAL